MIRREKIIKLTLVLISVSFSLLIVELVLRNIYPQISDHDSMFQYDSELGWSFIPSNRGAIVYPGEAHHFIEINEAGFRDDSFEDLERKRKVVVIGDSFVSNVSVASDDVFTEVLEERLEATSVLNFGVNGYGQTQELLLMQRLLGEFDPEMVILMIYVRNDFTDNVGRGQWDYDKPIAYRKDSLASVRIEFQESPKGRVGDQTKEQGGFYRKIHLYHLVRRSWFNIKTKYFTKDEDREVLPYQPQELVLCKKEPSDEMLDMEHVMQGLIIEMSNVLKAQQKQFVLAIAPSMIQVEDELWNLMISKYAEDVNGFDRTLPNSRLKRFAEENDILTVDLFESLYRESQNGLKMYNRNEQHWTVEGNRVVAKTLEEFLEETLK